MVELGRDIANGQWSPVEARQSSTWRELKAVDQVLRSFAEKLAGHRVKWFTDNQNVYSQKGSRCSPFHLRKMTIPMDTLTLSLQPQ